MEEQQEFKREEIPPETPILVGFGKHDLKDVMDWIGTEKELDALQASIKWPPRYRRLEICEDGDVERFIKYTEWIATTGFRAGIAF
jgi:hypothetical protein